MTETRRATDALDRLMRPSSIVVVGASATRNANGNQAIANLKNHGHESLLSAIHPTAATIEGLPTFPDARRLPAAPDLALISVPAAAVLGVLRDLADIGCAAAIVHSGGFDKQAGEDFRRFCAASPMVVHGPNCNGVINYSDDIPLWFEEGMLTEDPVGSAALITQSGSAAYLVRAAETARFSKIIATGNQYSLSAAEYMRWLARDPHTAAVGVVMESITDPATFTSAVEELRSAQKPVVVLKVGVSGRGAQAVTAHTEALVSSHDAYRSFFDRLDVPTVADYDQMATALDVLTAQPRPRPSAHGITVLTSSGGEAALAGDLAERHGVQLPNLSPTTRSELTRMLPGYAAQNPLDTGGSSSADRASFTEVLDQVAADPAVGSILTVVEAHATAIGREYDHQLPIAHALRAAADRRSDKAFLAVSSSSTSTSQRWREVLGPKVPLIRGITNAYAAATTLTANRAPLPMPPTRPASLPDAERVDKLVKLLSEDSELPHLWEHTLLSEYGIPVVGSRVMNDLNDVKRSAADLTFPLIAKLISPDIAHRSDIGGVIADINDLDDLERAFLAIQHAVARSVPDARFDGIEVQRQVPGTIELLIGTVTDPTFGSLLTIGAGGVLVELTDDTSTELAPVDSRAVTEMLSRTKIGAVLAGYRNLVTPVDLAAITSVATRLSWLAHDLRDCVTAVDLNPVIVDERTGLATVVDPLMVRRKPTEPQ